ncbi:hypothetical protein DFH06DRAFT_1377056 [Mycena polygramma]|nr:hypothetical protein DFH06DRAFT_1377056 [Mycena polygramma]
MCARAPRTCEVRRRGCVRWGVRCACVWGFAGELYMSRCCAAREGKTRVRGAQGGGVCADGELAVAAVTMRVGDNGAVCGGRARGPLVLTRCGDVLAGRAACGGGLQGSGAALWDGTRDVGGPCDPIGVGWDAGCGRPMRSDWGGMGRGMWAAHAIRLGWELRRRRRSEHGGVCVHWGGALASAGSGAGGRVRARMARARAAACAGTGCGLGEPHRPPELAPSVDADTYGEATWAGVSITF